MRKTIYYCDRCRKEIEEKPLSFQATVRRTETETVDICESCANDLMAGIRQLIRGDKEVHFSLRDLEQNIDAQEEIELSEVVRETVKELRKNGLLKRSDDVAYSEVSSRLYEYYRNPERDPEVEAALEMISGDFYAGSIADYYQEHLSLDVIAEAYHCDLTTIKRNKKRLCLKIFQLLQ